jgi:hypothetical protein
MGRNNKWLEDWKQVLMIWVAIMFWGFIILIFVKISIVVYTIFIRS